MIPNYYGDYKYIIDDLEKIQKDSRHIHSLGVAFTAVSLAMKYECDLNKAFLAGILHDCAKLKDFDDKNYINICEEKNISITDYEHKNPFMLHGKVGAIIAKEKYKIEDEEVLSAVINHIVGKPSMTLLEKIIFIADYIEPGRTQASNLAYLRKLAFEDPDACVYEISVNVINYLKSINADIDERAFETLEYYKKR
jgi:predicted HD superfamily hydrolase involved in NAD metabolism